MDKIIEQKISDTYNFVAHCSLPSIEKALQYSNVVNLYDGNGVQLSYGFTCDIQTNDNKDKEINNIINVCNSLNAQTLSYNTNSINAKQLNSSNLESKKLQLHTGTHLKTLNDYKDVTSLIEDVEDDDLLAANYEYSNRVFENQVIPGTRTIFDNFIRERDWSSSINAANKSSITINLPGNCNAIVAVATCSVLAGDSHGRTGVPNPVSVSLYINDESVDINDESVDSCECSLDYWNHDTTGNKSKSYYHHWLEGYQHMAVFGQKIFKNSIPKTVNIKITSNSSITNPYIAYIVCTG